MYQFIGLYGVVSIESPMVSIVPWQEGKTKQKDGKRAKRGTAGTTRSFLPGFLTMNSCLHTNRGVGARLSIETHLSHAFTPICRHKICVGKDSTVAKGKKFCFGFPRDTVDKWIELLTALARCD